MKHKLLEAIDAFVSVKSPQTKRAYIVALAKLAEFLRTPPLTEAFARKLKRLSGVDAAAFSSWLRAQIAPDGQRMADATVSQRFHLLRRLCKYLVAVEAIDRNPFDAVIDDLPKRQRRQKRPTKLIPWAKIQEMLELPDRRTREGVRDYCILSLLFGGGLRRSEVYHLNVEDVIVNDKGTLSIVIKQAKAGWNQTQSLPPWAAEAFTSLVSQRAGEGAKPGEPLFVFYHAQGFRQDRLAVETIVRIYKRYTERVGLGKIPPHSARASAATYLLQAGCSEVSVAMFLRHCNEDQVKVYDKRAKTAERNPGLGLNYRKRTVGEHEPE